MKILAPAIGAILPHAGLRAALPQPAPAVDLPAGSDFSSCAGMFPGGKVIDVRKVPSRWAAQALCANHFAVLYSRTTKTPLLVVERLTRSQLANALDEQRTDEFYPDPRIPRGERAELDDYRGSGFDRGHMAPAGDQPDHDSMQQSFVLSNMIPQDPTNNRKIWSKIESDVRKFARRAAGAVYVFTGPIFGSGTRKIGASQVWVPSEMFKLVYDEASGRSWVYFLANTPDAQILPPEPYDTLVARTGWRVLP